MQSELRQCITDQVSVKSGVLEEILDHFEYLELSAGEYFIEAGRICRRLAFINRGVLRIYNIADGDEVTLWIGSEHRFITALTSFIHKEPSRWYIEALTDAELLVISREDHFKLLDAYPEWLEFDNRILVNAYAMIEQRMFSHLYMGAEERYRNLMAQQPDLFNRVPLRHIASMLGMTPETLSRLRSKQIS